MNAEIIISYEHATALWRHSDVELLWVDGDGVSSVINEDDHVDGLDETLTYAIDGRVVGEPYVR